jgi:hypothetical protein
MIVISQRNRGSEKFDPMTSVRTLSDALEYILVYELGYGGQIVSLKETEVTTVTSVMNCIDTTVFKWAKEEHKVVMDVIATYVAIKKASEEKPIYDKLIDQVMAFTGGNPLKIKMAAGVIMGQPAVKATLLHLIGSEEHLDHLKKLKSKDLFAVFDLVYLQKQKIDDVIELTH